MTGRNLQMYYEQLFQKPNIMVLNVLVIVFGLFKNVML